jgi:[acyl-carrier-protein] S-malonyltransferase
MSGYAFLLPGQGAQQKGMALDLFEASAGVRALFDLASGIVGRDMQALLAEADAETLKRGDIAQPAITLANLAASAVLRERGIVPAAAAGHSLGEYAALAVCGVISEADAFYLTAKRGEFMQAAADTLGVKTLGKDALGAGGGGMAAVLGLPPEEAVRALEAAAIPGLYAANFNSPRQTVVSGTAEALAEAETLFKAAGAKRVIRLPVAGPFHCPLMAAAADRFAPVLDAVAFADPSVPFYSNVTGALVASGAEAKTLALRQICAPVRWLDEERALAASGIAAVLEAGPGRTLCGLWKDAGTDTDGRHQCPPPCHSAGTLADIGKAIDAVR